MLRLSEKWIFLLQVQRFPCNWLNIVGGPCIGLDYRIHDFFMVNTQLHFTVNDVFMLGLWYEYPGIISLK